MINFLILILILKKIKIKIKLFNIQYSLIIKHKKYKINNFES
jgi:hypothetical protein